MKSGPGGAQRSGFGSGQVQGTVGVRERRRGSLADSELWRDASRDRSLDARDSLGDGTILSPHAVHARAAGVGRKDSTDTALGTAGLLHVEKGQFGSWVWMLPRRIARECRHPTAPIAAACQAPFIHSAGEQRGRSNNEGCCVCSNVARTTSAPSTIGPASSYG